MNTLKTQQQKESEQLQAHYKECQRKYELDSIHPIWFWAATIGALILVSIIEKI